MGATDKRPRSSPRSARAATPRVEDPRVVRTRAAVVDAARALFLQQGYAGTTMEQIAARAGLTKRTVYNNYGDKDALFTQIVADVLSYAETFARGLHEEFDDSVTAASLRAALDDLARRLALGIVRPEVLAIRCLLIGEARTFPALGSEYFDRAPGQVLDALASRFAASLTPAATPRAGRAPCGRAICVSRRGCGARPRDAHGDDAVEGADHRVRKRWRGEHFSRGTDRAVVTDKSVTLPS